MVKISKTKHITKKGVVKSNPRRKRWEVSLSYGLNQYKIGRNPFKSRWNEAMEKADAKLVYWLSDFGTVGNLPIVGAVISSAKSKESLTRIFSNSLKYDFDAIKRD